MSPRRLYWSVAQLASLAQRLSTYGDIYKLNQEQLGSLVDAYEQGEGVQGRTKNLIFASTGPKPDLVLRDAVSNDIEIVANGDTCLIYDQPLPNGGLKFSDLVAWWAAHQFGLQLLRDRRIGRPPPPSVDDDVAAVIRRLSPRQAPCPGPPAEPRHRPGSASRGRRRPGGGRRPTTTG